MGVAQHMHALIIRPALESLARIRRLKKTTVEKVPIRSFLAPWAKSRAAHATHVFQSLFLAGKGTKQNFQKGKGRCSKATGICLFCMTMVTLDHSCALEPSLCSEWSWKKLANKRGVRPQVLSAAELLQQQVEAQQQLLRAQQEQLEQQQQQIEALRLQRAREEEAEERRRARESVLAARGRRQTLANAPTPNVAAALPASTPAPVQTVMPPSTVLPAQTVKPMPQV
jgi:hypothetical protein